MGHDRCWRPGAALRLVPFLAGLAVASSAVAAGTVSDGRFSPGGTPAAQFGASTLACGAQSAMGYLMPQLEKLAKERGKPVPEPDGRLCAMADSLLGWKAKEEVPGPVASFTAQHFGVPTAPQQVLVEVVDHTGDREVANEGKEVAARAYELVGGFMLNASQSRFGMAVERIQVGGYRTGKRQSRVVIVLLDSAVALDPVPRRLAAGQSAPLSGSLLGNLEKPVVLVGDVAGKVTRVEAPAGQAFKAEVHCGDRPGQVFVEVRGGAPGGAPHLVANFKVACGVDLPTSVPLAAAKVTWPGDVAGQEHKALDEINAERATLGLAALGWDDAVAGVAREVSARLRDGDTASLDLGAMLAKAGAASGVVLQNPGQALTAQAASERFLQAPTSRENLLSPEVTHAGIGLVQATDKAGLSTVFMTQLFVKQLPAVDVEKVRQELRDAIAASRAAAKVSPLASDPTFEEPAQRYAKELADARGELPPDRDEKLVAGLSKGYVVKMLVGPTAQPLQFAAEKKATTAGSALGVGVAQGVHKNLGRNAFYVVILIAEKTGPGSKPPPPAAKPAAPKPAAPAPKPAGK